jgi:hypothetical protein
MLRSARLNNNIEMNMNITSQFEIDLREWCKTQDTIFFEQRLYEPFRAMAASIVMGCKIKRDLNETISDLVSEAIIKLPLKYNPDKGTAKATLYVVMKQYLLNTFRYNNQSKRDQRMVMFIENLDSEYVSEVIEVEVDEIKDMREALIDNKSLFNKLQTKLQRKIAFHIIDVIETMPSDDNYIKLVAKKSKCGLTLVYEVIQHMRELLNWSEKNIN